MPSGKSPVVLAATSIARRVLPAPPAPVRVTSRLSARMSRISTICVSRPTKVVSCVGRCCAAEVLVVRRGGKSLRTSGWQSCATRIGRGRSRSGWRPRSVSHASSGSRSSTNSSVAADNHGLSAVRQIAQTGRFVDRRARVVAFIAQLHFTGVQADAQLDRRQAGPVVGPARMPPRRWRARMPPRNCRPRPARPDERRRARQ